MTSRQPYWCTKAILWEFNSLPFFIKTLPISSMYLHVCWLPNCKRSVLFPEGFKIEEPNKINKPGLYCIQFTDIHDSNRKYALKTINGISLAFEASE